MNFRSLALLIYISLFSISLFSQSKCYIMYLDIGKKENKQYFFLYSSLTLNEDKTFISTSLFDLQHTTCGIYEIKNDMLKLKEFKSTNIFICDETDSIKKIITTNYETIPFKKLKIKNDNLKHIQIIDTPGVNDPVISREQKTKEILKEEYKDE